MKATASATSILFLLGGMIFTAPLETRTVNARSIHMRANRVARPVYRKEGVPSAEQVIRITAKNFEFTPGTITVKKGVPVVLELSSGDRRHGFSLRAFGVRTDVKPGSVSRVSFTPDRTGRFTFTCDVFCGDGHEQMTGTLVVID
jgi:cytochrome c oxidase subunit 2